MRSIVKIFLLTTIVVNAHAYTAESLFRNGPNKDIVSNTVIVDLNLKKLEEESLSALGQEERPQNKSSAHHLRLVFHKKAENFTEFTQVLYLTPERSDQLAGAFIQSPFFRFNAFKGSELSVEKHLFYGLITTLFYNDSTIMSEFFKRIDKSFLSNKELINKEKKQLLEQYKKYLQSVKDEPTLKGVIESPLVSEDPEKAEEIKTILSKPFITPMYRIRRVKERDDYITLLELENFTAKFSNDHRLMEATFVDADSISYKITAFNYMLQNGTHEAPQAILLEFGKNKYLINVSNLQHLDFKPRNYSQWYDKLLEARPVGPDRNLMGLYNFLLM